MWVSSPEAKDIFEKSGRHGLILALVVVVALACAIPFVAEAAASSDHWFISRDKVVKITSDEDTITFEDEGVPLGELAEEQEPAKEVEKPKRRSSVKIGKDFPGFFNIEIHDNYDDSDDLVRFGEHIIIEEDEVIEGDVVAIGGSIDVRGKVMGDVVSVGGSLNVASTGMIDGDAVSVGGTVNEEEGSQITGDVVSMSGPFPDFLFGLPHGKFPSFGFRFFGLGLTLAKSILVILLVWLIVALFTERVKVTTRKISESPLASFGMGLLIFVLLPVAMVLLCITLIGIPVAILLPLAVGILGLFGYAAVGLAIGNKIIGGPLPNGAPVKAALIGVLIMEAIPLVGKLIGLPGGFTSVISLPIRIIGYTIIACAVSLGLGAAVLTKLGRPPLPIAPAPSAPPVAPGAGAPPAAPPPGSGPVTPPPTGTPEAPPHQGAP
ncbi:MAG: hypothetical protein AMJ46_11925 [Latescibacteria bacterium DG_63]|nr:MAG: hypothetical protein AMJ46_11925 [Latescibacteria bacterium DG_63]